MKTITIDLSVASCKSAIKVLEKYERQIKPKMDEVCKRLAAIGEQEANAHLALENGNTDARVFTAPTDRGYKLVMEGEDVYFIEFGTGDKVSDHYDTSVPVAWGTWSAEHKQMLWNYGFWYYDKVRYTGTKAYMPMYYAGKKMREEMPRVVEEVFGK